MKGPRRKTGLSTREMERINWLEFRDWVPARINTVLLPLGTLEPHGVTANGTDIIIPLAMARDLAPRVNAMIAPVVPYGFTGSLDAYPGSFTIPENIYREYVRAVLVGLARNKFKNVVMLNGHGAGQTAVLAALAQEVGRETATRILTINWWSYCTDVCREVFGEDGGHAGNTETAYMLAIDSELVEKKRYTGPKMATAIPTPNTWNAYPFPSSILLYKDGEGYPNFDLAKAKSYFKRVNEKIARLIEDTIKKWDMADL
jgi:creatinine amidohydrolase